MIFNNDNKWNDVDKIAGKFRSNVCTTIDDLSELGISNSEHTSVIIKLSIEILGSMLATLSSQKGNKSCEKELIDFISKLIEKDTNERLETADISKS